VTKASPSGGVSAYSSSATPLAPRRRGNDKRAGRSKRPKRGEGSRGAQQVRAPGPVDAGGAAVGVSGRAAGTREDRTPGPIAETSLCGPPGRPLTRS
jgi:hypothetical protein